MSRIAVVGSGYVGLTTAACLAALGHKVTAVDIDAKRIEELRHGRLPIQEHGLGELVRAGIDASLLDFDVGAAQAAADCDFAFLCVPTPRSPDGSADLSYIRAAACECGPLLPTGAIVVNKSTVPVGSTLVVEEVVARDDIGVVSNPEFLREGTAVHDFFHPDRIVVGATDGEAALRVAELYESLNAPVLITDPASAETIKYASNAFLATKISFANAIANVCEAVGADVSDVVLGMSYDTRIGREFLRPGPGYGGSCLPKDTSALVRIAENAGYNFDLLRGVIRVNEEQFELVVAKVARVARLAGGTVAGARLAVWGLAFKAGTDDIRQSPAVEVIRRLVGAGANVAAYDPAVDRLPPDLGLDTVALCGDAYAPCDGAEVLVVLTEWEEFRRLDMTKVASLLAGPPRVVDARNLLDAATLRRQGFVYEGIGR